MTHTKESKSIMFSAGKMLWQNRKKIAKKINNLQTSKTTETKAVHGNGCLWAVVMAQGFFIISVIFFLFLFKF